MTEQTKLLNADFNFVVEDMGNNRYQCSALLDRTITIDIEHHSSLYVTNKFGQKSLHLIVNAMYTPLYLKNQDLHLNIPSVITLQWDCQWGLLL